MPGVVRRPTRPIPVAGRPRDDHGTWQRRFTPGRSAGLLQHRLPQDRVPPPPPTTPRHGHRPCRPAPPRDHHLRMPRPQRTTPRRTTLRELPRLRPPGQHRRPLSAFAGRGHRRPRRPDGGDHHDHRIASPACPRAVPFKRFRRQSDDGGVVREPVEDADGGGDDAHRKCPELLIEIPHLVAGSSLVGGSRSGPGGGLVGLMHPAGRGQGSSRFSPSFARSGRQRRRGLPTGYPSMT